MWYSRIVGDLIQIPKFIEYYDKKLDEARKDITIQGNVQQHISQLPGLTEIYFSHLQEIEAVLNFLNIELRKLKKKHFQIYLEKYAKALSSRDAEKYTEGTEEVCNFDLLVNEVALLRNRYLGLMKGFEQKSFMLGHLTRLKTAGMEDFTI